MVKCLRIQKVNGKLGGGAEGPCGQSSTYFAMTIITIITANTGILYGVHFVYIYPTFQYCGRDKNKEAGGRGETKDLFCRRVS